MGFLLGLINGFLTSFEHRNIRKAETVDTIVINVFRFTAASVVLAILSSIFSTWSLLTNEQIVILVASLAIETIVMFAYVRSFQRADQSLVGPLFGLSLLFLVPFGSIFLGETPSLIGSLGISLVLLGILYVGWTKKYSSLSQLFRELREQRGVWYMVLAAFSASIAVILAKKAYALGVHPLNFGFYVMFGLLLIHTPLFVVRASWRKVPQPPVLFAALFFGGGQTLHYVGLDLIHAAYYIPLKRSSMLFDVLIGRLLGQEKRFKERITGASIMFLGIILIALAL